jgi:DNA-binding LacI/PurR family transcriptional regulator
MYSANICGSVKGYSMKKKYIVSLKKIAEETGVSISTVSRVIKRKGEIAQETREMVLNAANRLGYHSNILIEGMRTGKTKTIGVMIPIRDEFFNEIVYFINQSLMERDYMPINVWQDIQGKNEKTLISRLIEQRVEGIIIRPLLDWVDTEYFSDAIKRGLPVITLDRKISATVDFIGTDDYTGGQLAAKHIIDLGHRNIAYYQGPQETSPGRLRREGFEQYTKSCSDVSMILYGLGGWRPDGIESAKAFLSKNAKVTAIAAFSDIYALEIYDAAWDMGKKIPEDVSVIGFGNLHVSRYAKPKMTTINQFPDKIADALIESLFARIENASVKLPKNKEIRIKPQLIDRNSTRKITK